MLKGKHKSLHPLLKIAEWLLIIVACTSLLFGVWYVLPVNHASTGSLLLFQALQAVALFIVPALIVAHLWSDESRQWLKLTGQADYTLILLSIGVMITAVPLINWLVSWNQSIRLPESLRGLEQLMQQMEAQADAVLQRFLTYRNGAWWVLLLNLLILAVLPAIGEELTFRGVLQGLIAGNQHSTVSVENCQLSALNSQLSTRRSHMAVWVTAFVFSFVHFQFYGFIPRLLLGALLGYALLWSGTIGYSMIMHATNNAVSVLLFYLGTYVWHTTQQELDALGTGQTAWLTWVCTPVMCMLIYLFYRRATIRTQDRTP